MLAAYYTRIGNLRLEWTRQTGALSEDNKERARSIRGNGFTLIREAQDYISDPDFTAPMLKDEDIV
jgi:hypothetical protein